MVDYHRHLILHISMYFEKNGNLLSCVNTCPLTAIIRALLKMLYYSFKVKPSPVSLFFYSPLW